MPGRYLITGVAGSGKSTLERVFRDKGYITVDIDEGFAEWRHAITDEVLSYTPEDEAWHQVAEWTVRTPKLQKFFDAHADRQVLVFGSFARMKQVVTMFDEIFLLTYPNLDLVRQRIAGRGDGYGSNPHELERILSYVEPYQARMQQAGAREVDCTQPLDEVVDTIAGYVTDLEREKIVN